MWGENGGGKKDEIASERDTKWGTVSYKYGYDSEIGIMNRGCWIVKSHSCPEVDLLRNRLGICPMRQGLFPSM